MSHLRKNVFATPIIIIFERPINQLILTSLNYFYIQKFCQYRSNRRYDFLDPDFGVKASLKLASKRRNKCNVDTEASSEIPELGLDTGRVNIDCDINPVRVAQAAARIAHKYREQRARRPHHKQSGSTIKRKRTRINIDYVKSRENVADDDNAEPQQYNNVDQSNYNNDKENDDDEDD